MWCVGGWRKGREWENGKIRQTKSSCGGDGASCVCRTGGGVHTVVLFTFYPSSSRSAHVVASRLWQLALYSPKRMKVVVMEGGGGAAAYGHPSIHIRKSARDGTQTVSRKQIVKKTTSLQPLCFFLLPLSLWFWAAAKSSASSSNLYDWRLARRWRRRAMCVVVVLPFCFSSFPGYGYGEWWSAARLLPFSSVWLCCLIAAPWCFFIILLN